MFGRTFAVKMISPDRLSSFDKWFNRRGLRGLLLMRFVPLFSFNLLNYGAGLTKISLWQFTWTTGIGILPPTFLMAWLYIHAMNSSWGIILLFVGVVVFLLASYLIKKNKKQFQTISSQQKP